MASTSFPLRCVTRRGEVGWARAGLVTVLAHGLSSCVAYPDSPAINTPPPSHTHTQIDGSTSFADVKAICEAETGIPSTSFVLLHNGKPLTDT